MLRFSLLLLLLMLPARANLGEPLKDCVQRYGSPVGYSEATGANPFGTVVFSAGPYTLVVFVLKNVEVGARVSKTDKSAFADSELQNILNADTKPGPWTLS